MLPVCRTAVGDKVTESQVIWLFSRLWRGGIAEISAIEAWLVVACEPLLDSSYQLCSVNYLLLPEVPPHL